MKKLLCFILVTIVALSWLSACKKQSPSANPSSVATVSREQPLASVYQPEEIPQKDQHTTENKELTAKGCPPLAETLQKKFAGAKEMVDAFYTGAFSGINYQVSKSIDGNPYWVIVDERFPTYTDFVAYLQTLFTTDVITGQLLTPDSIVKPGPNGLPCVLQSGKGMDGRFAGYVFKVDRQTPYQIDLTATVYYAPDVYEGELFYTTPANPDFYTTKQLNFTLVRMDDNWLFSQFPFIG